MSQVPFSQLVAQLSVDDALRAEFYDQFEEMFDPSQTDSRAMWQKLMEERPYFATAMVDSFGRDKFGDNYQPHSDPPNQMLDPYRMVESFEGVPTGIESMVSDFLTPLGEEGKMGGGYIFIVGAVDIGTSHTFGALGMDDPDFPPGPNQGKVIEAEYTVLGEDNFLDDPTMAVESKKSGPSCLDLASTMAAVPFYAAGIAQGSSLLAVPAGLFLAYQLGRAYMALR